MSLKVISAIPRSRNTPRTIAIRQEYINNLALKESIYMPRSIIYIDEMGRNLHCRRLFGRSIIGQPAYVDVPVQRGENLSMCAGISVNGVVLVGTKILSFKAEEFIEFLSMLLDKLDPTAKHLLIMDNAPIHHSRNVKNWFNINSERVEEFFLPPYSPFLNPIEECFSKIHYKIAAARPTTENTWCPVLQMLLNL